MTSRLRAGLLSGVVVAMLGACSSADAARVGFSFFAGTGFSPQQLVIEYSDGSRLRRVTGEDFASEVGSRWDTAEFDTRTGGTLRTSFWLIQGGDTLALGELDLELRRDFAWNIGFHRADGDPADTCFGCAGSAAYPLAPALQATPADSLWVVWGGNSISHPVVY